MTFLVSNRNFIFQYASSYLDMTINESSGLKARRNEGPKAFNYNSINSDAQNSYSLVINNLVWSSDLLSVTTLIRKRGASLYLLLPAPVVRALSLRDGQKANITILTAERGARIGLFIDLGTPKISTIFYEVELAVEPLEAAQTLINRVTNGIPTYFISLKAEGKIAKCVLKFTSRDLGLFFEVRNIILREAKRVGAKVSFLNVKQEEASFVPLDLSLLKEVVRGAEGYELVWE
jgi:hypothetical protein